MMKVYVFSEKMSLTAELIANAKGIDGAAEVSAIIIGPAENAEIASKLGVSQVFWLGEAGERLLDDFVPTISALLQKHEPELFLAGATIRGKAIAARVAARMNTAAVVNAKAITADRTATHMVYGGSAIRKERSLSGTLVATVTAGTTEAAQPGQTAAPIVNVTFVEPTVCMKLLERIPKKAGNTDIMAAKRVVGTGRGFYTREDLQYARKLAEVLDGAVGYTRPVTEVTPPIVEGEPYIGVSGIAIKPDLYIAVAVSGQTQHTAGVVESKTIVCINSDPEAPMFKLSDFGIVGDYKEVIPALITAINAEKAKEN